MWGASARAHVHAHFQYLVNGCVDCIQIWCVNRDPLDSCFTHVGGGDASARAHVQIPFPYQQHEQPTFGPQRYPKSAASQVTEGWLNMRQQLFVRIVVFLYEKSTWAVSSGRIFKGGRGFGQLATLLNDSSNLAENFSE